MNFIIPFLFAALPVAPDAQSPGVALPKTTEVMVILTTKQGMTRQQIMAIMPSEIRETVKLYLDGKIRQWYSRGELLCGRYQERRATCRPNSRSFSVESAGLLPRDNLYCHDVPPLATNVITGAADCLKL